MGHAKWNLLFLHFINGHSALTLRCNLRHNRCHNWDAAPWKIELHIMSMQPTTIVFGLFGTVNPSWVSRYFFPHSFFIYQWEKNNHSFNIRIFRGRRYTKAWILGQLHHSTKKIHHRNLNQPVHIKEFPSKQTGEIHFRSVCIHEP